MKKFKELMVMLGIMLAPIVGACAETKEGLFWTLFVLALTALLAWDAGMLEMQKKGGDNGSR